VSRGELWWVDFHPSVGSELGKRRPALIVGREALSRAAIEHGRGTVTVAPLTSNISNVFEFHVLLSAGTTGLHSASKVQAEQIRTVSVARLVQRIGQVPETISRDVDRAIRLYLGL